MYSFFHSSIRASQRMKTGLFWIALGALLVQALGYNYGRDEWERRFLEHPQEEAGYAAMYLEQPQEEAEYGRMAYDQASISLQDTGDTGTPDETGPPSDHFMREILNQPKPEDGRMAYDQASISLQDLREEIVDDPAPSKLLRLVPSNRGQLNFVCLARCTCTLRVPDVYICFLAGPILHGSDIAIQLLHSKRHFIGCYYNPCRRATCPGLYFEDNEWNNCWGEVFRW